METKVTKKVINLLKSDTEYYTGIEIGRAHV